MSRVMTTYYQGAVDTRFWWATAGTDLFRRDLDLYYMSQALERHTHAPGYGRPVATLANSSVTTDNIADLSVTTPKIANLAVTNTKLGPAAVTFDKIAWPLIQAGDSALNGFAMRSYGAGGVLGAAPLYGITMWVAANGLVSLGAGTPAVPAANIVMGQGGQVTIGTALGAGLFSIIQKTTAFGAGFRLYNPAATVFYDWYVDASGYLTHTASGMGGSGGIWYTTGRMCIGNSLAMSARLNIAQTTGNQSEGIYIQLGASASNIYMNTATDLEISSPTTAVMLMAGIPSFRPITHNTTWLGHPTYRWSALYTQLADVATNLGVAGTLSVGGVTTLNGSLTVVGGITGTFTGGLSGTSGSFSTTLSVTGNMTGSTATFSGTVTMNGAVGFAVANNATLAGEFTPATPSTGALGVLGSPWGSIYAVNGFKTSGINWVVASDIRTKDRKSIRPYDKGLETLRDIHPVYYTQNGLYGTTRGGEYVGVVADDVEHIVPEMIQTMKARRTPEAETEEDLKLWDASNLTYMLVRAVQEMAGRIEDMEASLIRLQERKN